MEPSQYHKIDNYLLGRLTGKALEDFEQKLQSDAAFAKAVAEQKQGMDLLRKVGDMEMKMEVQEVQRTFRKGQQPKTLRRFLKPLMAAASILLFIAIAYWNIKGPTNEQLFDKYYLAYNTSIGARDQNDERAIKLAEASAFYKKREYEKAVPIFESLGTLNDAKAQLMAGISYLEVSNYNKANSSFRKIINEGDPVFQYHAIWYSAMVYLKSGDTEKCKAQLEELIGAKDPNGVYKQEEAKKLLEKL